MTVLADLAPRELGAPTLSLRRALVAGVIALNLLIIACVAAILVLNARWATQAEIEAAFALSRSHVVAQMSRAPTGSDPLAEATALAGAMDQHRHVRAMIGPIDQIMLKPTDAPAWFADLVAGPALIAEFPITHYPNVVGTLHLVGDPSDEIDEVWQDFRVVLPTLLGLGLVTLTASLAVILGLLGRIETFVQTVARIRRGDLGARVPDQSLREFATLARGINDLAVHLAAQKSQNRRLNHRLLTLSETERRAIASDLHDGMGPCLFAMRATVRDAERLARAMTDDAGAELRATLAALSRHAESVQALSRSVISALRPMVPGGTALGDALRELSVTFRDIAPRARIKLRFAPGFPDSLGEAIDANVYRFVQESVLNAIKHGQATAIKVSLSRTPGSGGARLVVRVIDNGCGPPQPDPGPSLGQMGIMDRISALDGAYVRPICRHGGTLTEMCIPCR